MAQATDTLTRNLMAAEARLAKVRRQRADLAAQDKALVESEMRLEQDVGELQEQLLARMRPAPTGRGVGS